MGEKTEISWCDSTANLWIGCQKVSAACDFCYAEDLMAVSGSRFQRVEWGPHGQRLRAKTGWLDIARWQRRAAANGGTDPDLGRRRRIFINSLSDFFDNHKSVVWRDEAWALFRDCPDLIFILVTKRPQLIAGMLPPFWSEIAERVWLLTTAENQEEADRRIPHLLASCYGLVRPAVFGVSVEPMLGPVSLDTIYLRRDGHPSNFLSQRLGDYCRPLIGNFTDSTRIGWVIVGGESGKHARPMDTRWARALCDECIQAGVPFHFKQWGEFVGATGQIGMFAYCQNGDTIATSAKTVDLGDGVLAELVGKRRAGRLLDGQEHLAFPEVA